MIESMCGACVLVWPDTQTKLSPINTHARYNYWYDLASYTHENDKCPHLLDWTSKNTISDQTNILLYWWFCLRLFHVSFSLRRKTEMFFFCIGCSKFLYQIIALFGWSLFLIWLHLTIVTSWFSSLKFLCFKKNDVFAVDLYCSPIFMNIQFDTLHIHHMHDAQQKKTHTNWSQLSFKTTNIY